MFKLEWLERPIFIETICLANRERPHDGARSPEPETREFKFDGARTERPI